MSDLKLLQEAAQKHLDNATAIQAKAEDGVMTQKQTDAVTVEIEAFENIKAQIEIAKTVSQGEEYMDKGLGPKAAPSGWRPTINQNEGNPDIDPKAFRTLEIDMVKYTPLGPISTKKEIRYHVPLAVQTKEFPSAFEAYLRVGKDRMQTEYPSDFKTLMGVKTLTEAVETAGGMLVPAQMQASIIKKVATNAVVRNNALVITSSRDVVKWPRINYPDNDEYTSGTRFTWTGESPSASTVHRVTDPVFGEYTIPVHTAMASMPISADLIEDAAFDIIGIASDLLGEAFMLGEEDAFWNGNAITRPKGLVTSAAGSTGNPDYIGGIRAATGATLDADELIDLRYALPTQYESGAQFYFTRTTEREMRQLKDSSSDYLWPVRNNVGSLGAPPDNLQGFPYNRAEFVPERDATSAFSVWFGDLNAYLIADRVGLSIKRLDELYAETNLFLLLARKRLGAQVVQPWRLKVLNTSST